jgi:ankyrin repeat protein
MVEVLLAWKPSLAGEADGGGSTPLHFASSDGDLSVVGAILLAAPSTVRTRDSGGLSALHIAAGMGHARVARALIEACPDTAELLDERGGTFLHAAARGGHSKVVQLAIATEKPTLRRLLNMQDGDGNTPLHLAVAARAPDIADVLLRNGKVRADVMNTDGHTPFDLAAGSTSVFSVVSRSIRNAVAFPITYTFVKTNFTCNQFHCQTIHSANNIGKHRIFSKRFSDVSW